MIDQGDLSGSPANGAVQAVEGLLHLAGPPGFLGGPRFLCLGWGGKRQKRDIKPMKNQHRSLW
jgi:hypothetical protein